MSRILLTGATGFVGSQVARVLVEDGHDVAALIRPGSSSWRLAEIFQRLTVVEGDLQRHPPLSEICPDVAIHLAWYAEPGKYLHSVANLTYITHSIDFVQELLAAGCDRVVCAGTCFEYDTRIGELKEDSPTAPDTLYAASKLALLQILTALLRQAGSSLAWMRFFYMFGPYEDERRLVPYVIRSLLSGERVVTTPGEQVRDYLHVADAARAVATVALSDMTGIVNVASGRAIMVRELVQHIAQIVGRPDLLDIGARPYSPNDPMYILGDNTKLLSLGWRPTMTIREGLADTVDWMARNRAK